MDTPLCPRCHRDLTAGTARERPVWACAMCGGVWLDDATSTQLVNKLDDAVVGMAEGAAKKATFSRGTAGTAKCPICAEPLERSTVGGVQIDVCSQHGTWFDRGELQQVAQALKPPSGGGQAGSLSMSPTTGTIAAGTVAAAVTAAGVGATPAGSNLLSSIGSGAELAIDVGGDVLIEGAFSLVGSVLEGIFS